MNEQTAHRMTLIFNEWARRYAENPDAFTPILDEKGNPVEDYGEMCTRYFQEIADDMERAEILSQVRGIPAEGVKAGNHMGKEYLGRASALIQALLPDNHLFFLVVASVGQFPDNTITFTSSMSGDEAVNVMKKLVDKWAVK